MPRPREDMEIRDLYSHSSGNGSSGGIRLWGVIALEVGDAVTMEDLQGVQIPYYDSIPANFKDFILYLEDFAEKVVGDMRHVIADTWACPTFPHCLASELTLDLRDQFREKRISAEEECLVWLEQEEKVDARNLKLDNVWSIPLNLECGELRLRDWRKYLRKYREPLKQVEDWSDSSEIRHLLRGVLPAYWR